MSFHPIPPTFLIRVAKKLEVIATQCKILVLYDDAKDHVVIAYLCRI